MLRSSNDASILLINPPCSLPATQRQNGDKFVAEHIGLGYLAGYVRHKAPNVKVHIIDAYLHGISAETVAEIICASTTILVGFSVAFHPALEGLRLVFNELRARGWRGLSIVGGNHASLAPAAIFQAAPEVSVVVHGDGEEILWDIIESVRTQRPLSEVAGLSLHENGQISRTATRPLISNLDLLPFPARDSLTHVLKRGGTPYISASRGCYARCKFCTITEFYGSIGPKWRGRSPDSIAKEMQFLADAYSVDRVFFVDDNFIGPGCAGKRRVLDFANELSRSNVKVAFSIQTRSDDIDAEIITCLKDVGLRIVFLGLESGSQEVLNFYQKDNTVAKNIEAVRLLEEHGIGGIYGLIMFNPNTTWKQFYDTLEFIELVGDYNLQWISSMLRDLPGAIFELELNGAEKIPSSDGFTFFEIRDAGVRHLARMLSWLMEPVGKLCSAWEERKWSINMRYERNLEEIRRFRELTSAIQRPILHSVLEAARIVEDVWVREHRRAGELDLVTQRVELNSLSADFHSVFGATGGATLPLAVP